MRRYYYFAYAPGALFALFPFGVGFFIFGFFPFIADSNWRFLDLMLAAAFDVTGVVLWAWSPRWTQPYWMRDDASG